MRKPIDFRRALCRRSVPLGLEGSAHFVFLFENTVRVGIMVTHNPLYGSGQAGLPHPALTSGDNAQAAQGIRMTSAGGRQPAVDQAPHPVPKHSGFLAAPQERAMPEPTYWEPKPIQRRTVGRHSVITNVSTHDRPQPLAHFGDGVMHASFEFGLHLAQLRLQPFANRLPQDREASVAPLLPTDVGEAEEVERLRFPFSALLPVFGRERAELQQARFLGMQFQAELPHSLDQFCPEPYGIRFRLEARHNIVSKPHDDHVTAGLFLTPRLGPQVEHIMEIDVSQQRRGTAALGRPFFHLCSSPILQHAGVQPFLDEPHDASVRNPMLDELHQSFVGKTIEKAANVHIERPVHLLRQQSGIERIQRVMLASPRAESARETQKVGFVDSVQYLDGRALDDLVFQHRNSERSLPPVALVDVRPTHRLGPIRPSLQPMGEILEIILESLAVVPPRLTIHTGRGFLLQTEVGLAQRFQVVDVVEKRCEPCFLILTGCLTYPLQRTGRVFPARCPGRVLLLQVPFGQTSSLHPLRCRWPSFVRRLRRYYRSVRLPVFVHHRRASLGFPMRPQTSSVWGERGISRFPCEVLAYVHGVCDRAGSRGTWRYRRLGSGLRLLFTASASRSEFLTRLNTRPIRSPVNASSSHSRAAPRDSGPLWFASPSTYETFIHNTSPVLTGAQGEEHESGFALVPDSAAGWRAGNVVRGNRLRASLLPRVRPVLHGLSRVEQ